MLHSKAPIEFDLLFFLGPSSISLHTPRIEIRVINVKCKFIAHQKYSKSTTPMSLGP